MYNQIASNKRKTVLLIGIFLLLIIGIGWSIEAYFDTGPGILAIASIIAVVMSLVSYFQGDKIALAVSGAKQITATDNPYVYHLVENLCIAAGLPMPKVYGIPDGALNAFACGRDPQHASIAVTDGIVKALENEELEGVIAHELSHIRNYDVRLATVVIVCVGLVALIADLARHNLFWGGARRRSSNDRGLGGILALVGIILIILAPLFAQLIQLAISRKREYLADASGSLLTRYPEGLARALEKIAASDQPLSRVNRATAHLFLASPYKNDTIKTAGNPFSTHPPIAERIKRLRAMA
ncbi:MAG: zinc metalloprotease HtpX [Candidatus Komeilibacteria bacterium RIFCSPLOWO2_01_FULL_52_15]|uniref:Protease HtpX homolog n=2 Tax=Candidatus Komeiliibacteriota TaxID=1817908 RepID=A0A1G2BPK6_9BACT|nr:MAG: zinc metalloprotease HtpX [Candidatus Komeilibacteria bacterium RIFCSPHIGHO2_01_FULL_52_14]OGY90559.1 MAG: zinc metalloprotease HtpX [Candidatus Komeilibacteria bacterium RIFCSPLOWO2_01_FULL_52_15]